MWNTPLQPNGVVTQYQLRCSGSGQVVTRSVLGSQTTTTLSGLLPYTTYSCSNTAHTSAGGGPAATVTATTAQDGELYEVKSSYSSVILPSIQFLVDLHKT